MLQQKFGLRRLLGAAALCGGMAVAATGVGAGVASAAPWFPPPPPRPPVAWFPPPPPPPVWVPPPPIWGPRPPGC